MNGEIIHLDESILANLTMNSSETLSGNGTVGTLTINSGGILSPGNSLGVINAATTVFNPVGNFVFQVNTDGTGKLDVSNLSPSLTFALDLQTLDSSNAANPLATFDPIVDHVWTDVITTTAGFTGTFNSADFTFDTTQFQNALDIGHFSLVQDTFHPDNLDLEFTAAPEPSTWTLMVSGLGLLLLVQMKRRKTHL